MRKVIDRDLVSALVLLAIGAVSVSQMGTKTTDWAFPRTLTYTILAVAAALILKIAYRAVRRHGLDALTFAGQRQMIIDILVFCTVVLVYVLLVSALGFWLDSFLMLVIASVYLTTRRTIRSVLIAITVAAAICVAAYFLFLDVFYVPFP